MAEERLITVKKPDGSKYTDNEKYIRDSKGEIIRTTDEYLRAVINQADEGGGGAPAAATGN